MIYGIFDEKKLGKAAKELYLEERRIDRLDGWFIAKEIEADAEARFAHEASEIKKSHVLLEVLKKLPLSVSENAIFCGTQRDAFAKSYALINPSFRVEDFSGYCDPAAIYNDIEPNGIFSTERIEKMRAFTKNTAMVKKLGNVYANAENYTKEAVFFIEQVSGHVIPDMRYALAFGTDRMKAECSAKDGEIYRAMEIALDGVAVLAERYYGILEEQKRTALPERRAELVFMQDSLSQIAHGGAENLHQAIQLFMLMWQIMCLEQAPNPYAFSVGNADRIFEPYRNGLSRSEAAELFKHFLVFFNVGDRSWAISQNILVGGRTEDGNDLTNVTTYALIDAFYAMNLPQPILSVKLHKNTPEALYCEMGRFFFSPGVLTPSLFNDDSLFEILRARGVDGADMPDCAVAGCQEPLIMGKDNGNTTNSWLNLPKVLEAVLTGGYSLITGEKLMDTQKCTLDDFRSVFYNTLEKVISDMADAANGASVALSEIRVPFLSALMGGIEYGADMRDTRRQGTKYNGSGCLVHGVSVLADSFIALDRFKESNGDIDTLVKALRADFKGYDELKNFLHSCDKFGNGIPDADAEAAEICRRVSDMLEKTKNYLGNGFRPDFSSPSTHLLYGYWVGATPDGRESRSMLNYGVDPLFGDSNNGLGFRTLSLLALPFERFTGGYASHLGIDPKYFKGDTLEDKGAEMYRKVIRPLFFNENRDGVSPFYLYVNVTTPETLRAVLREPKKYAPDGVYIMRIHGTFVNFLDLSPAIQQDIIQRLDPASSAIGH